MFYEITYCSYRQLQCLVLKIEFSTHILHFKESGIERETTKKSHHGKGKGVSRKTNKKYLNVYAVPKHG